MSTRVLVLCSILATIAAPEPTQDRAISGSDAAVYNALLQQYNSSKRYGVPVVLGTTYSSSVPGLDKQLSVLVAPETASSFHRRNRDRLSIAPLPQATLLLESDYNAIFDEGACDETWTQFHASHPDTIGLWRFSAVGYSEDETEAVVCVVWGGACLAGFIDLAILRFSDGAWRVTHQQQLFIA